MELLWNVYLPQFWSLRALLTTQRMSAILLQRLPFCLLGNVRRASIDAEQGAPFPMGVHRFYAWSGILAQHYGHGPTPVFESTLFFSQFDMNSGFFGSQSFGPDVS